MVGNRMRFFALSTGFAIIGFVQPAILPAAIGEKFLSDSE